MQRYTTEELRKEFLIENLYQPGEVTAVYSHVGRMVVLGIMPVKKTVPIDQGIDVWANFGTRCFLERREAGTFNLGGPGVIVAGGETCRLSMGLTELAPGGVWNSMPCRTHERRTESIPASTFRRTMWSYTSWDSPGRPGTW